MQKQHHFLAWLFAFGFAILIAAITGWAVESDKKIAHQQIVQEPVVPAKDSVLAGKSLQINDVPHFRQQPDFCGEACAAMVLRKLGQPVDQDYVFDQSGLNPLEGRGCYTRELATALQKIGFNIGPVWYPIPREKQAEATVNQWQAMMADLAAGVPSIICMHYDTRPNSSEHFRLILGYDATTDEVIYHEPAEEHGDYRRMKRSMLLELWPLMVANQEWNVIRFRMEPGTLKQRIAADTFTSADYAQHVMKLKKKIPSPEFTVVIQHPFVVIGDESPAVVRRRAVGTIQWAVDQLKQAYFAKDPQQIIDIWLFKDQASYQKHTQEIFRDKPDTPFGYFSHADQALIMNIATGGGTLVHEIVHPFVAANFPECPAWLNEGLGSLYEQSAEQGGQIIGLTNWRLAGLQETIQKKQLPSFKTLCSTTTHQFYQMDKGSNYAQARYLCYYLQEHGLLRKFYHQFRANCRQDPTGYNTLQAVLGQDDMDIFKKNWEAYIMKLHFPEPLEAN